MAPYIQSAWEGIKPAFESAGNLISQVVGIIRTSSTGIVEWGTVGI